jgi:DUF3047 family protein
MSRLAATIVLSIGLACLASLPAAASHDDFERAIKSELAPLAGQSIIGLKVLYLSADVGPWLDTGMEVRNGDKVTIVLDGKIVWSKAADIVITPSLSVWARVGDKGTIFRGARNTNTFVASENGRVFLKHLPVQWRDPQGGYEGDPAPVNPDWSGGASVALIKWAANADTKVELQKLAAPTGTSTWAAAELDRLKGEVPAPSGWHYLWQLGPWETFREVATTTSGSGTLPFARYIDLDSKGGDGAILQRDVPKDLTPTTHLEWTWRVERIPASTAENTMPTHDYVSIGVEFDNGQDLTYIWSHSLPVGHSFRCPLPGWDKRETHLIARSGSGDLNKWVTEKRNVFDDYKTAVGGEMPKRITRVWLLGITPFRRAQAKAQFADMWLTDGQQRAPVW